VRSHDLRHDIIRGESCCVPSDEADDNGGAAVDELTQTLQTLLEQIGELGRGLEDQLALLIEDQRSRSPFAYLMEPAEAPE
jgi:hypothetical protein